MRVAAEKIEQNTGLIPIENVDAIALFTGGKLDDLLKQIEAEVKDAPTDTSTERNRKDIASVAYKVSRSKVVIDDAGKELVATWKKQAAEVDKGRKQARDFLDALRDRVREPLTDWEDEQARIEGEKRMAAAAEAQRIEEEKEAALRERERLIAEKEAELAKQEAERLEKERQAQAEAARKAREEQIARDAAAMASFEASEAIRREQEARERAEQQAKETAERAAREAIEAVARAHREKEEAVENERLRAARDAEERDRIRRVEIVENARQEAARKTDKANRDIIYGDIISALRAEGFVEAQAHKIVRLIAEGIIPHVQITY